MIVTQVIVDYNLKQTKNYRNSEIPIYLKQNKMEITINYKGVDFDVEYDYQPYERQVMYYSDGSGHPGCSESIEGIYRFEHKGTCFLEWIEDCEEDIEELILKKMHEY